MKTNKNHTQTTTKRSTNAATVNNTTQAPATQPAATTAAQEQTAETPDDYPATLIDITRLRTSPYNPRRSYDKQGIRELADTMREVGLLHPIHARIKDGHYEIITAECLIPRRKTPRLENDNRMHTHVTDDIARDMALTENLQRGRHAADGRSESLQRTRATATASVNTRPIWQISKGTYTTGYD